MFTDDKIEWIINRFGQVAGYKIDIQKLVALLYTDNEQSVKEIKKTIPFIMTSKRIKNIGINLTKEVKDSYTEIYKTLLKEITDTNIYSTFMDWNTHIVKMSILTDVIYSQYNLYLNSNGIFWRNRKVHPKIHVALKSQIAKIILKKNLVRKLILLISKYIMMLLW